MSRRTSLAAALLTACLLIAGAAWAQSSSGTITGRVLDPTGQTVPGATLTLTKTDTLDVRTFTTPATGDFVFTALQPGPYSLKVQASGFKLVEKTDLNLSASERLPAGDIMLQVGSLTDTISVTAETATGPDRQFGTRGVDRLQPGQQPDDARSRCFRPARHTPRRGL